jgi:5-methylcytosine-specific restriction endonuclease McrA
MTEYKTCTKCGQEKPITDYYPDSNTGRYRAACKACCNKSVNAKRATNPESYRKQNLAHYYANKDELNNKRRAKWPELYRSNIEYHKQKGKKYRTENPDKINGIARRKRARKRANGWERYTEAQVLALHNAVCHICGNAINLSLNRKIGSEGWEMSLHIDHVIPISKGGPDKLSNVKPSHAKCNLKKRDKLPDHVEYEADK